MALRSAILEALDEWEKTLKARVSSLADQGTAQADHFRLQILEDICRDRFVSFTGWRPDEMYAFCLVAYPRETLVDLTFEGELSAFFQSLHSKWRPSFHDWAYVLWRFSGRAHELFADLLFLMPDEQRAPEEEMGRVLFREFVQSGVMPRRTLSSVIVALIPWPFTSSMAQQHEKKIFKLSRGLNAVETGIVCRSLLLYRSRVRCRCGYKRNEDQCMCHAHKRGRNRGSDAEGEMLRGDLHKEYALALYKLVLAGHESSFNADRWTDKERAEFLLSACEYVFSEQIYVELHQNMYSGQKPVLRMEHPRPLSEAEIRTNAVRSMDHDYDHSFAQHAGCIEHGCKQFVKTGCTNISCKQHCDMNGSQRCKAHRNYNPRVSLTYRPRPRVKNSREILCQRLGEG